MPWYVLIPLFFFLVAWEGGFWNFFVNTLGAAVLFVVVGGLLIHFWNDDSNR